MRKPLGQEHAEGMTDRDDFLDWVKSTLYEAERALLNGDLAPRRAIWSRNEPVSILGALRNAYGQHEVDEAFAFLERSFSDCSSYTFELQAYDVVGDMAYTAGLEHASNSFDGQPRSFTLRATQVYRREGGEWKVAHRHAETVTNDGADHIRYSAWAGLATPGGRVRPSGSTRAAQGALVGCGRGGGGHLRLLTGAAPDGPAAGARGVSDRADDG
jgi:ketosteroid isomerase-like protein